MISNLLKNRITQIAMASIILMAGLVWFGVFNYKAVRADINPLLNFTGKVTDTGGTAVTDGVYNFSFGLYATATSGTAIWSENLTAANMFAGTISGVSAGATSVTYTYNADSNDTTLRIGQYLTNATTGEYELITDYDAANNTVSVATTTAWSATETINNRPRTEGGVVNIDMGAVSDLSAINFNQVLYLEVTFNSETMQPRKVITPAAAAFNADKLDGYDASDFGNVAENTTVTGEWSFNNILSIATSSASTALTVTQSGAGDIVNFFDGLTEVFTITDGGNVGIGTSTPYAKLSIWGGTGNLLELVNAASSTVFAVDASGNIRGGTWIGNDIGVAYGGTGTSTFQANSLVYASSDNVISEILPGLEGQVLLISGGKPSWASTAPAAAHSLLSVQHSDTTPAAVQRGDIITGQGAGATWARLALGASGYVLYSNGTDVGWQSFGAPFYAYFSATTTDALAQGTTNKYYSTLLFAADLAATTTTALAEGSNLYYTNARARLSISETATGLDYNNATGVFSLTANYGIPLTASTTNWNGFYDTPSSVITAGTGLSWSGNTLNASGAFGQLNYGAAGSLTYYPSDGTTATGTTGALLTWDDTNGRLGIGTTSPYSILSVSNSASTAINTPLFTIASTTAGVSTSTLFTILANGNVGIGTAAPSANLELLTNIVGGSGLYINASSISSGSGLLIEVDGNTMSGGGAPIKITRDTSEVFSINEFGEVYPSGIAADDGSASAPAYRFSSDGDTGLYRITSDTMGFATGGINRLTINSSGNVGIGTTTPNWNLQIASSTKTFLTLSDMSAGTDDKHWFLSSMGGNFYIGISTDALNATSTYLTIAKGGNIMLGSGYSDSMLTLNQRFANNGLEIYGAGSRSGYSGNMYIDTNGTFNMVGSGTGLTLNSGGDSMSFVLGASIASGNAFGYSQGSQYLNAASAEQTFMSLSPRINQSGTANYVGLLMNVTETGLGSGNNYLMDLRVAGDSKFNVRNNGYTGIGTTSPYSILSISNSASTAINTPLFTIASTTAGVSTSTLMTVLANGNVGIGTANPNYNLDISGYLNVTNYGRFGEVAVTLLNFDTENTNENVSGGFRYQADDGLHFITGNLNSDRANNNIIITTSSNMQKDHDHDTYNTNPTLYIHSATNPDTNNTEWGNLSFMGTGIGGGYLKLQTGTGDIAMLPAGNIGIGTTTPYAKLSVWGSGTSGLTAFNVVDSASTTLFAILDNGNVGIASSTPFTKLGVIGNAYIQGNLTTTGTMTLNGITYTFPSSQSASQYLKTEGSGVLSWATIADSGTLNYGAAGSLTYYSADGTTATGTTGALLTWDDTNARLAIGTTSPYSKLSVWGAGTGTGKLMELVDNASTTRMVVLENGNVGIGTAAPSGLLEVNGGTNTSANIKLYAGGWASIPRPGALLTLGASAFDGGAVVLTGGTSDNNGSPGNVTITGGQGYNLDGGKVSIVGGGSYSNGGIVELSGGNALHAVATRNGGNVYIVGGTPSGSGNNGNVLLGITSGGIIRGNIGIGTTSPYAKLSVWGSGTSGLTAFNVVDSASTTLFSILDNGNVGIASSSPFTKLGVIGNAYIQGNLTTTGTLTLNGLTYTFPSSQSASQYLQTDGSGALSWATIADSGTLNYGAAGSLTYYSSAGTTATGTTGALLYWDDVSGRLGIGTTSPYSILSISNSANTAINTPLFTIASTTAGVSTSTLFTVLANGNVGIGTVSPNNLLQVADLINFNNTDYNSLLGYQAGKNIVSGAGYNTFLGYQSGYSSSTASTNAADYNTAIGTQSLFSNTTGYKNVAVGNYALYSNTTGYKNTAIGSYALSYNTDGGKNSAMGYNALYFNTTGSYNSAIGQEALYFNNTGSYNTVMGMEAGYGVIDNSFSNNSLFGYRAGYGLTTGNNNILIGYQSGDSITSASNNTIIGYQAGQAQTTATRNTFLGYQSGYLNTAGDNTFIGYQAGDSNTSGVYNTFLGVSAGQATVTGANNTFLGYQAGYSNTADDNTFIGRAVGISNTTGYSNSAMGRETLYSNTTGYSNTAMGNWALNFNQTGSNNTAVGYQAGIGVSGNSFSNNSLFGYNAGYALTTGSNNILLGYQAGDNLTTGASNIIIGYDIDAPLATSANTLNIGNLLFGTGINGTGTTLSSGKIGIGTSSPYAKLSVWGTGTSGLTAFNVVDSASTTLFAILDNGNVGIASSSPFTKLGVIGNAYIQGNLTTTGTMTLNGITYTFPSSQAASQYLQTNGAGTLSWATIADSGTLNYGAAGSLTYYSSSGTTATGTTGALLYWNDSSGYLGIGTTSPQAALHIGTASSTNLTTYGDSVFISGELEVGGTAYLGPMEFGADSGVISWIDMPVTSAASISTPESYTARLDGTDLLTIYAESDGAGGIQYAGVGIGSSTPFGVLSVQASSTRPALFITQVDSGNQGPLAVFYDGGTEKMRLNSSGYLGIGTSSPAQALSVSGNVYITGTTNLNNIAYTWPSSQTANYYLKTDGSGALTWTDVTSTTGQINYGAAGSLTYYSSAGTTATGTTGALLAWDNTNARLGVGTTTPYSILSISNSASTAINIPLFTIASTTAGVSTSTLFTVLANGNVGIGTANPNNLIQVADLINFNNTDYNSLLGYQAGKNIVSGAQYNTFIGYQSGYSSSTASTNAADYNTAVGYRSLYSNTTGDSNTAVGWSALRSNTTGNMNSAVGDYALQYNTSGGENSAFGERALRYNITGYLNTAMGSYTLLYNEAGDGNTAMGAYALLYNTTGSYNSVLGVDALQGNTTGNWNSVMGYNALHRNETGSANTVMGTEAGYGVLNNSFASSTLVGHRAGYGLSTGSNNILLGYQAGDNLTTGASNIIIGYDIDAPLATSANTLNIGNLIFGTGIDGTGSVLSSGKIGIGTTTPQALLTVGSSTPAYLAAGDKYNSLYVSGLFEIGGTGTSTMAGNLDIKGALNVGSGLYIDNTGVIRSGTWQGTVIGVGYGGTGLTTITANQLLIGGAGNTITQIATSSLGLTVSSFASPYISQWTNDSNYLTNSLTKGYFIVGDDAGTAQATSSLFISSTGNIGIGTTDPLQKLHVEGQCVTGDSELITEDGKKLRIDKVKGGEYVMSLDEKTGKLTPAKIKGLLDMGVQPIYEIETEDGKKIRTTGNHPYLVKYEYTNNALDNQKTLLKNSAELLERGGEQGSRTPSAVKRTNYLSGSGASAGALLSSDRRNSDYIIEHKNGQNKNTSTGSEDVFVGSLMDRVSLPDKYYQYSISKNSVKSFSENNNNLADFTTKWVKVAYLDEGDKIAVANDDLTGTKFIKIKRISLLPAEQVYDIEVEGTHNFVANGIIAHNTYISGNTGIGTTTPQALLTVGSSTPAYLLSGNKYNSLYVSGLFETGGTGTSTMAGNLDIKGALNVGSGLYIDNTGVIRSGTWQGSPIGDTYISSAASWNAKQTGDATLTALAGLTITSGSLITGAGADAFSVLGAGTGGYVLAMSGGTPTWVATTTLSTITGILSIDKGGTNAITIGSAGSVPYSTGSAYGFSATGTLGQVLISGATGAPTWYAPTAGSILFAGTDGRLQQDNSNFFWNDTSNRLGIGTTTPVNALTVLSADGAQLRLSYDANNYVEFTTGALGQLSITPSSLTATTTIGSGDEALRIDSNGNIGIGTTTPYAKLSVVDTAAGNDTDVFVISTSTSGAIFRVTGNGNVYADGTITGGGADYAEYFWTKDINLESGEVVCVDVTRDNAVKRCETAADGNVMGIISTKPAIVGNAPVGDDAYGPLTRPVRSQYVIVGLLGQVPAKVSTENGEIRPGDSLTPASIPGYVMKANAGDSTVGVALEAFADDGAYGPLPRPVRYGAINVLISRRNKSLTVETVEEQITKRIADMEIEDEVNIMIANAINSLNLDEEIAGVLDPKLFLLATQLTATADNLTGRIENIEDEIFNFQFSIFNEFSIINDQIAGLSSELRIMDDELNEIRSTLSGMPALSTSTAFYITKEGNLKMGEAAKATTTPDVAIVEIGADSDKPALIVNQIGNGDVADFRADGVSIVNISESGKVIIVGELAVDGRIMVCAGGACGAALDNAVDETMGDMGVEGTIVAGAFAGYCEDGFVWVPGSAKYGTLPGFCVMAGKARTADTDADGYVDLTLNIDNPTWVNVSQGEAMLACQALGDNYHLLSENEWLTIAENVLRVSANDAREDIEGMQLATSSAGLLLDSRLRGNDKGGVAYSLTNGNIINGLVGEVGEWTDQTVTKAGIFEPVSDEWQEYYDITDYKGFNIAPPYYYTSANGIGKIKTGDNNNVLRGFVRGYDGVFSLDLSNSPATATSTIGFRCAK